jgi:NDP-sugar pyrophosphorylase family protein
MRRHALVLSAGLGTRLQPLTRVRAKPALPVAGEPLVRRIIRGLAASGVTELVLNLHHLPATLTSVVGDGSDLGARVRYSWEHPAVLGSAGGLRHALPLIDADAFLAVNGDTLTEVDLAALDRAHSGSSALVTLALVPNPDPDKYGGVRLSDDGAVVGFAARGKSARGSFHFVGVQIVQRDAIGDLPDGTPLNSIGGVYNRLIAARPGSVRGYACDARFWDVGTVRDYWAASFSLLAGRAAESAYGNRVVIDPSARVSGSILWDDVEVGADCQIEECILTDGVRVPAGSVYRRAVLLRGSARPLVSEL